VRSIFGSASSSVANPRRASFSATCSSVTPRPAPAAGARGACRGAGSRPGRLRFRIRPPQAHPPDRTTTEAGVCGSSRPAASRRAMLARTASAPVASFGNPGFDDPSNGPGWIAVDRAEERPFFVSHAESRHFLGASDEVKRLRGSSLLPLLKNRLWDERTGRGWPLFSAPWPEAAETIQGTTATRSLSSCGNAMYPWISPDQTRIRPTIRQGASGRGFPVGSAN
jgi:hypothetical protein